MNPLGRTYFLDPLNIADVVSGLGLPLRLAIGVVINEQTPQESQISSVSFAFSCMLRCLEVGETVFQQVARAALLLFLPLFRLLKFLRYFEALHLLIDAFVNSFESLPVLVYLLALIVAWGSTAIYLFEERSNIPSMHHSIWLAIVTMTSVGYGDLYPVSLPGYLSVSVLTFASILFLALPIGIIGHEFTMSWHNRAKVLLINKTRKCLEKWGYSARDVKAPWTLKRRPSDA